MNKYSQTPCNVKMSLIAKDIKIEKICTNEWEVYVFERDMPCKHGLLFSGKPYIVGRVDLNKTKETFTKAELIEKFKHVSSFGGLGIGLV